MGKVKRTGQCEHGHYHCVSYQDMGCAETGLLTREQQGLMESGRGLNYRGVERRGKICILARCGQACDKTLVWFLFDTSVNLGFSILIDSAECREIWGIDFDTFHMA